MSDKSTCAEDDTRASEVWFSRRLLKSIGRNAITRRFHRKYYGFFPPPPFCLHFHANSSSINARLLLLLLLLFVFYRRSSSVHRVEARIFFFHVYVIAHWRIWRARDVMIAHSSHTPHPTTQSETRISNTTHSSCVDFDFPLPPWKSRLTLGMWAL